MSGHPMFIYSLFKDFVMINYEERDPVYFYITYVATLCT